MNAVSFITQKGVALAGKVVAFTQKGVTTPEKVDTDIKKAGAVWGKAAAYTQKGVTMTHSDMANISRAAAKCNECNADLKRAAALGLPGGAVSLRGVTDLVTGGSAYQEAALDSAPWRQNERQSPQTARKHESEITEEKPWSPFPDFLISKLVGVLRAAPLRHGVQPGTQRARAGSSVSCLRTGGGSWRALPSCQFPGNWASSEPAMNDIQPSLADAGGPSGFAPVKSYGALSPVRVCFALGNQDRWRLVKILSDGQPKSVAELARALGRKFNGVGRHIAILRRAGIVAVCQPEGANRRMSWQEIPVAFRATPGVLDFGCCTVRL